MGSFHLESIAAGGDRAVLRIDGDIDACTAPQLRERVLDLAGNGTVHVIADLRGVGFLDSAGLGALVAARKEPQAQASQDHRQGRSPRGPAAEVTQTHGR
jgi:anti-sigma B factor antagonist